MPKLFNLFTFLFLVSFQMFSQFEAVNYTNSSWLKDVQVDGEFLWACSEGGLTKTNMNTGEKEAFLAYNSPLIGGGIYQVEKGPDGSIWLGSYDTGLYRIKNGEWTHFIEEFDLKSYEGIHDIQIGRNDEIWILVKVPWNGGLGRLFKYENGSIEPVNTAGEEVGDIAVGKSNKLWLRNDDGIHHYDYSSDEIDFTFNSNTSMLLASETYENIASDAEGNLILCTGIRTLKSLDNTLELLSSLRVDPYVISYDDERNPWFGGGFSQFSIRVATYDGVDFVTMRENDFDNLPVGARDIYFNGLDNEGGLIMSVRSGLTDNPIPHLYNDGEWRFVDTNIPGPSTNYLFNITNDCNNNIWVGGVNRGIDVYINDEWQLIEINDESSFVTFEAYDVAIDPNNCDVWVCNGRAQADNLNMPGLIQVGEEGITYYLEDSEGVTSIEFGPDGTLYAYSRTYGFGIYKNETWEWHDISSLGDQPRDIIVYEDNKVFISFSDEQVYYYDGTDFIDTNYDSWYSISSFYIDNDGLLWGITNTPDVFSYQNGEWTEYKDLIEEPFSRISGIAQDKLGNYWLATDEAGLLYWNKEDHQVYTLYDSPLNTQGLRDVLVDNDDHVWLCSNLGVTEIIPSLDLPLFPVKGFVYYDENQSGEIDGTEAKLPNQKVEVIENESWTYTGYDGYYKSYIDDLGPYTFECTPSQSWEATTPLISTLELDLNTQEGPSFGLWKEFIPKNIKLSATTSVPVCNREFSLWLNIRNDGYQTFSEEVELHFSDELEFVESSIDITSQEEGKLTFAVEDLAFLNTEKYRFSFETPGVDFNSTELPFMVRIDCDGDIMEETVVDTIRCSYDPNDKKVIPTGEFYEEYSLIEDALEYTIRFQNEGTYKAFEISIADTLSSYLDPSTFNFLGSSHPCNVQVNREGHLSFNFEDINLPPSSEDEAGSQGYIKFGIKPFEDVIDFTEVNNTAYIYFDYNPAIITNTTSNTLVTDLEWLATDGQFLEDISIFPNPTKGEISISSNDLYYYYVTNLQGQVISKGVTNQSSEKILISDHPGMYILHLSILESQKASNYKVVVR